jgi:serine protease inhibitor
MMHLGSIHPPIRQDDGFIGVTLAYETPGYSLTMLTTKGKPATVEEFATAADWLTGSGFQPSEDEVRLSLPKFDAAMTAELLPALEQLGLKEGFSSTDFERLAEKPLAISAVVQKTVVRIEETGTEAAAVTAVVPVPGAAAPSPPKTILEVTFDKPFIFALRDDRHGMILVTGYVGDPRTD